MGKCNKKWSCAPNGYMPHPTDFVELNENHTIRKNRGYSFRAFCSSHYQLHLAETKVRTGMGKHHSKKGGRLQGGCDWRLLAWEVEAG